MSKTITSIVTTIDDSQKNAISKYTGPLFSDIDFNQLNSIIDKISENKEELTDGMRKAATKFANDWDTLVVNRLEDKKYNLQRIEDFFMSNEMDFYEIGRFFDSNSTYYSYRYNRESSLDEIIYVIIDIMRSKDSWAHFADSLEEFVDEYDEMKSRHSENEPQKEDFFLKSKEEMTYSECIVAEKEYEIATAKYNNEVARDKFNFRKKFISVRKELNKNKEIKEFIKVLKVQSKKANEAVSLVHEKSSLVNLAINFGGTNLLKALQELHEFQKNL